MHSTVNNKKMSEKDVKWIESAFSKRECCRYVPSIKDVSRCACGQNWAYHKTHGIEAVGDPGEIWGPSRHTIGSPTDAYGTIDFLGGPHPNKAQFIRLSFDSKSELILQLLTREWGLELPKLLISVHGGKANFELNPRLKKVLRKGLLRAAKTTGAWILTGGTNTGVTRHVGDALISERSPRLRSGRVVSIGIAPWGVVENRQLLIGRKKDVTYLSIDQPRSKFAVLNNRHAYFLLVDNGTVGRYGAEIALRRKLEKFITSQRLPARTYCSIPMVCVVIEGGMHTIRTVLEYVTDSPPVPVVVCEGSGRAADLLAFTHKYASDDGESSTVLDGMKDQLVSTIQRTFNVDTLQAEKLYEELLQCVKKKNLITIFRHSASTENADHSGEGHDVDRDLDQAILSALFRSRHLSSPEQLSLALAWNRVDIARSEIFVYGQEWPEGALEEAMMDALVKNRVDFVKLLLETGVQMAKFLTISRLEELYNSKQGPANTLRYIVRDVRPHMQRNYSYTLIDIGLVINKLMGGAYRSSYTRRKFRNSYQTLMKRPIGNMTQTALGRVYSNNVFRNGGNNASLHEESIYPAELHGIIFMQPFNELLLWAVLTKRQAMAQLMWQHGEEALAKALVASKLYRAMAREAAEDDLEVEIYDELRRYAAEFEAEALDLLDYCYRQDDDLAQQLLTCELPNWSRQTCLRLAFACSQRKLLAHPCSQLLLADLWMGGLRTRRSPNLKVILGLFCPPLILRLEFKSKEELQLMPQTEEEHMTGMKDERSEDEDTSCSSSSSSTSSSPSHSPYSEQSLSQRISVGENNDNLSIHKDESNTSKEIHGEISEFPYYERRRNKQLRIKMKFYEFYAAPITKFWSHSIAYIAFLMIFTYTVLVRLPAEPKWNEYYIIAYIASFGGEKIREIFASEPVKITQKLSVWSTDWWNVCDAVATLEFFTAVWLRFTPGYFYQGRVLYCLNIVFWYVRILRILSVSKFLGPLITMIGKMIMNMIYFVTLIAVALMAYGVFRQSLLYPDEDASWMLARHIFFQPYFMIYGEVFADEIDPDCGGPDQIHCAPGRWLNPLLMTVFLLVTNILLLNLLIAVFNSIFIRTNAFSHEIWKFNRYGVVMEYEQKPALPPPLIIFSHVYLIIKWWRRRAKGMKESFDRGLKLFLDSDDLERLYDFEEECMEGLAREKETKLQLSTEERVRLIGERLDGMSSKIEDNFHKTVHLNQNLQALDFRMKKLEEVSEQTNASLAVIHRFMAVHTTESLDEIGSKVKSRDKTKSSTNLDVDVNNISPEDFRKNLAAPMDRMGRRSSCAFESENPDVDDVIRVVEPQDLAMLRSLGPVPRSCKTVARTLSDTSHDAANILQSMEDAERELAHVNVSDDNVRTPASEYPETSSSIKGSVDPIQAVDVDEDFATTLAIKSPDTSDKSLPTTLPSACDDMVEVFDSDEHEAEDTMDVKEIQQTSPTHRSYSVGGNSGIRKRFRNWSGTPTSSTAVSPRGSRRKKNSLVMCRSQESAEEDHNEHERLATAGQNERRIRLQAMHSCPGDPKWNTGAGSGSVCTACHLVHSSINFGSFNAQQLTAVEAPKMGLIPSAPLTLVGVLETTVNYGPIPRALSLGRTQQNKPKVEAEAEHLREMEGQDYQLMEGIIRRRLHRDSENLDASLEDLCNAPIKDESLDSLDEVPEIIEEKVNFILGGSANSTESTAEEIHHLPTSPLVHLANTILTTAGIKLSSEAAEPQRRIPPPRPPLPIRKISSSQLPEETIQAIAAIDEHIDAIGKENQPLVNDAILMSQLTQNAKVDKDVKIIVEDDDQS